LVCEHCLEPIRDAGMGGPKCVKCGTVAGARANLAGPCPGLNDCHGFHSGPHALLTVTFTGEEAALLVRHMQSSRASNDMSDAEQTISSRCWRKLAPFQPPPPPSAPTPRWQIQAEDYTVLDPTVYTDLNDAKQMSELVAAPPPQTIVIRKVDLPASPIQYEIVNALTGQRPPALANELLARRPDAEMYAASFSSLLRCRLVVRPYNLDPKAR